MKNTQKETAIRRKAFKTYLNSIGLKDSTIECYCDYLDTITDVIGQNVDELVSDDVAMAQVKQRLIDSGLSGKTASNLFSGLKNYYRFSNGHDYRRLVKDGDVSEKKEDFPDVPFEMKEQLNDFQFRLLDSQDSIWRSVLQIGIAVLTIVPAIVVSAKSSATLKVLIIASVLMGAIGTVATVFVLKRTARVLKVLKEHNELIRKGDETYLDFDPCDATPSERISQWIAGVGLSASVMAVVVIVVTKLFS